MGKKDIHFESRGCAGFVILDKQETLNAVTDDMLTALNNQLDDWQVDPNITRIVIKAAPGRAFSAGGDIRHLYERGKAKDYDFDFFAREYRLNARIAKFPKPYIALIDGIVMGGGVGVSFHGSHRVVGENVSFAMPEVGIGFFPDVGASYLLSRLQKGLGLYLGLTGSRVKQADALWSGLATHACKSEDFAPLEAALQEPEDLEVILNRFSTQTESGPVQGQISKIETHFDQPTLDDIFSSLKGSAQQGDGWASETLDTLGQKSPTSLAIAFQQISNGAELSIDECMKMEFRILRRILPQQEFYEGIRAAIIDKDNKPAWRPNRQELVDRRDIDAHFAPLGEGELELA